MNIESPRPWKFFPFQKENRGEYPELKTKDKTHKGRRFYIRTDETDYKYKCPKYKWLIPKLEKPVPTDVNECWDQYRECQGIYMDCDDELKTCLAAFQDYAP